MEKLITRTINLKYADVVALDKATEQTTIEKMVSVPNNASNKKILEYLNEKESEKEYIAVLRVKMIEQLYGMTENDFIKFGFAMNERKQYI